MISYRFTFKRATKSYYFFRQVDEVGNEYDEHSAPVNFGKLYVAKEGFKEEPRGIQVTITAIEDPSHEKD
jgi:hypothetical protein